MKMKIHPLVGLGVVAVVVAVLFVLLYRHNFRPSGGSMEDMPPAERAKILGFYGSQARPGRGAAPAQARPQTPAEGSR